MDSPLSKGSRWITALLALMLLAAACSSDSQSESVDPVTEDTNTPTEAPEPAEPDEPTRVVIGLEQELTNFNTSTAGDALLAGIQVNQNIWPSCLEVLPDFSFEPYFCERLPEVIQEDPLVVEYKLRADANWSDGTPVSSADMEWYYENCNDPTDDCISTVGYDTAELEVIDDKTVRMTWPAGKPFVEYIGLFGGLLPSHLGLDWTEGFRTDPIVAAGPYQFDEWNPGSDLTLVPNPNYFGDAPHIDEVTFRFISDVDNLPPALENGEVDVIYPQPQIDLVNQVNAFDGIQSSITFGPTWEHITFNTTTVPLEVRRAIALALDRELIVNALMRPFSETVQALGNRVFVNGHVKYQDNTPVEFQQRDVAAARATLEEAGYVAGSDGIYSRDGERLSLRIRTTGGNTRREQFQELVQSQLGEAGIEITVDNLPGGEIFAEIFPETLPGDFDLVIFAWVGGALPAGGTKQVFGAGSGSNPGVYVDERVDGLLDEALITLDLDRQAELLNEADTLMWETLPLIPVYQLPFFLAWNDRISNIQDNAIASFTWNLAEWTVS